MTDISLAAPSFAEREFRVGSVISAAITVLSRNLLPFCIVTAIANLPYVLLFNDGGVIRNPAAVLWNFAGFALFVAWSAVNQAILLYAAFEDMRGRPVDLSAFSRHARRRILPAIGTAFLMTLLGGLALLLLIVPAGGGSFPVRQRLQPRPRGAPPVPVFETVGQRVRRPQLYG